MSGRRTRINIKPDVVKALAVAEAPATRKLGSKCYPAISRDSHRSGLAGGTAGCPTGVVGLAAGNVNYCWVSAFFVDCERAAPIGGGCRSRNKRLSKSRACPVCIRRAPDAAVPRSVDAVLPDNEGIPSHVARIEDHVVDVAVSGTRSVETSARTSC